MMQGGAMSYSNSENRTCSKLAGQSSPSRLKYIEALHDRSGWYIHIPLSMARAKYWKIRSETVSMGDVVYELGVVRETEPLSNWLDGSVGLFLQRGALNPCVACIIVNGVGALQTWESQYGRCPNPVCSTSSVVTLSSNNLSKVCGLPIRWFLFCRGHNGPNSARNSERRCTILHKIWGTSLVWEVAVCLRCQSGL